MRQKSPFFVPVFTALLLFPAVFSSAQESPQAQFARRFQNGSQLYNLTRWQEATMEFRRAQEIAVTLNEWSHALYWVILSELAHSDYGSALRDMEELQKHAPYSIQSRDMVYHRARVYYNQGFFEDALFLFNHFNSSISDTDRESMDRRAAGFFWMGECLYAMGQYDEAEKFYAWVVARYPQSPKNQSAVYRIDLIMQKKIEAELLALLQWSHEESLRTSEDYQRKIKTYENTLNLYQRRLSEFNHPESLNQLNRYEDFETPQSDVYIESGNKPILTEEPLLLYGRHDSYLSEKVTEEPVLLYGRYDSHLLEKAIQLEGDVQEILRETYAGGVR